MMCSLLRRRSGTSRGRALWLRLGATMQSGGLSDGLVKGLSLSLGDRELESRGLTGTVGTLD